jgi:rRNA processing protein Krr1/Pno1
MEQQLKIMNNTEEGRRIGGTCISAREGRIGEERRGRFIGEEGQAREAAHTCTRCFVELLLR